MERLARTVRECAQAGSGAGDGEGWSLEDRLPGIRHHGFRAARSIDQIEKEYSLKVDYMRIRAYPFAHEIHDFVASHERVYVVEQDRDAQLASLLKLDLPGEQVAKLRSILHFNGLPLDACTITEEFATREGL